MWKAVGTVNPYDNKKNRSKDQVSCEPFAQASRLRLNESQLSGQQSHQFMNEYFTKKKSTESSLNRVLSQKTIEIRQSTSPAASLRQLQSPRNINKTEQILREGSIEMESLPQIQKKETTKQQERQKAKEKLERKCQKIEEQLKKVKDEQIQMSKVTMQEIDGFREQFRQFEKEIAEKLEMREVQHQKSIRQNINPQLVAKIKQEGTRFNQKMRDLDSRKEQLKAKYKDKLRKE